MTPLAIALCDDFREERWPSMDRVAAMLQAELGRNHAARYSVERVCPPFAEVAAALPGLGGLPAAFTADRFLNRLWWYPKHARSLAGRFDLFHVVDHSYAHLVHALPARRTIVTCHDLDAFRSVLEPHDEPRSAPFRAMTRRIAAGLGAAARVICDTETVRRELVAAHLVAADRTAVAPLGVDEVFFGPMPPPDDVVDILHVGLPAPRKRMDILLRVCGALAHDIPSLRLMRIGAPLAVEQRRLAHEVGIADRLVEITSVDEAALAEHYRRAAIVLQPSEREGFGLPVLEALASGTPVVASDIPVLREIGGDAATFCPVGDVDAWRTAVAALVRERAECPARWQARREAGRRRARGFTWSRCADAVAAVYEQVAAAA